MTNSIRYLLDENISRAVRNQLVFYEPTMNVVCIGDENVPTYGTPDEVILEWIEQTGYVLVSRNRRTMPRHLKEHLAQGRQIPGILLLRKDTSRGTLIEELLLIWHTSKPNEYQNYIEYIPL